MLPRLGRLSAWPAGLWRCIWFGRRPKILHQGRAGGNSVARKFEQLVELGLIDVTPGERDAKMSFAFAKRASGDPEKSGEVPWLESPETLGDVYWRRAAGAGNLFAEFAIFCDVGSLSKFNYREVQLVGELPNTQFFMVSSSHGGSETHEPCQVERGTGNPEREPGTRNMERGTS